jgi:NAD(P)-dependent dehydrogenase (short-subunit alcohol dehydrogenase family)
MKIDGQSAIVTGAGSGLGEATARSLAAAGARIALFDRDPARGERVAAEIGGRFFAVDVADEQNVSDAVAGARAAHGPARIVVNCAGIAGGWKIASRKGPHPLDAFERMLRVHVIGTFNTCRFAAAGMIALEPTETGERGVVINTSSGAAFEGQIGQTAYAAAKGAIVSMTLPIARDLADDGIRCVAIAPGLFATNMVADLPDNVRQSIVDRMVPFPRRLGNPTEFASLACEVIRNPMINGTTIRIDAASRLQPR